jgi:hypothetical protein
MTPADGVGAVERGESMGDNEGGDGDVGADKGGVVKGGVDEVGVAFSPTFPTLAPILECSRLLTPLSGAGIIAAFFCTFCHTKSINEYKCETMSMISLEACMHLDPKQCGYVLNL